MTQPFAGGPDAVAVPEVGPAYPAGLEVGRTLVAIGRSTDDGSELWLAPHGGTPAGDLPARGPGLGRRAHPRRRAAGHLALRARRPALPGAAGARATGDDAGRRGEVGRRGPRAARAGVRPAARRPAAAGRPRAARPRGAADLGRRRPTPRPSSCWTCPATSPPAGTPTARRCWSGHDHAARTELYRYDLATGVLEKLDTPPGVVRGATARPDGTRGAGLVVVRAAAGDPPRRRPRRPLGGRRGAAGRPTRSRTAGCPAPAATCTRCWSGRDGRRRRTRPRSWCTAAPRRPTTTPTAPAGRPTSTPATRSCT